MLKTEMKINKGCQILYKESKIFNNNQIVKNMIVTLENIDKNVTVAKGEPP